MPTAILFSALKDRFRSSDRMPVVFLGHGNPMNAISDTKYSRGWRQLGNDLPRPQAILCVSAHWMTEGATLVDVSDLPTTIHDFGNFSQKLFDVEYPASGAPSIAREVVAMLSDHHAQSSTEWGLDHGAWAVLKRLYPEANVPVFQLSIDMGKDFATHLEIGRQLRALRDRGVLVLGSGNLVHNLHKIRPGGKVHDWATEFDALSETWLTDRDFNAMADANSLGHLMKMAHPTPDHYIPALYCAGLVDSKDELSFLTRA